MSEWKLVPAEPTGEMLDAVDRVFGWAGEQPSQMELVDIWGAMLAAAPSPWQPIETAPLDGADPLLLANPEQGELALGAWDALEDDGWYALDGLNPLDFRPTVWMVAPVPPQATTSAREASPAIDVAQTPQTPAS